MSGTVPEGTKCCTKCGETRTLSEFPRSGQYPDGRTRYRSDCKPCSNARQLERKRTDPALLMRVRNSQRNYAQRWRAENPEEARRKRRISDTRYLEQMRTERPEQYRDRWTRDSNVRRARKLGAPRAPYSRSEIFARWDGQCCYCNAPAEHLDHVNPLSRGGADAAHNLVPACAPCNLSKGAKTLAEWVGHSNR